MSRISKILVAALLLRLLTGCAETEVINPTITITNAPVVVRDDKLAAAAPAAILIPVAPATPPPLPVPPKPFITITSGPSVSAEPQAIYLPPPTNVIANYIQTAQLGWDPPMMPVDGYLLYLGNRNHHFTSKVFIPPTNAYSMTLDTRLPWYFELADYVSNNPPITNITQFASNQFTTNIQYYRRSRRTTQLSVITSNVLPFMEIISNQVQITGWGTTNSTYYVIGTDWQGQGWSLHKEVGGALWQYTEPFSNSITGREFRIVTQTQP